MPGVLLKVQMYAHEASEARRWRVGCGRRMVPSACAEGGMTCWPAAPPPSGSLISVTVTFGSSEQAGFGCPGLPQLSLSPRPRPPPTLVPPVALPACRVSSQQPLALG